jgi:hypothetical protein
LTTGELSAGHEIFEILVVTKNGHWDTGTLKKMSPFLETSVHGQQFTVINLVVAFGG